MWLYENKVIEKIGETTISSERNKLVLTPMGEQVCQFMNKNFECIQSYDLTKDIEEQLDEIANGNKSKTVVIDKMYKLFNPTVEKLMSQAAKVDKKAKTENDMSRHKLLGLHPENKTNIYLYFGRFGPCIAEEHGLDDFKFTSIPKDIQNSVITLQDALKLLEFPKVLGKHAGHDVILKNGPYGAYVEWDKTRVSLSKIGKTIHNVKMSDIIDVLESGEHSMTTLKEYTDGMKIMQNANGIFVKKGEKMMRIPDETEWSKMKKADLTKLLSEYVPNRKKFFKKGYK
jgi:DNA topoisomerase-1